MAGKVRPPSKPFLVRALPRSIKGRIILLLLVVLVPILIIQGYMYYDVFRDRQEEELLTNLEMARATGKAFDGFIRGVLRQELFIGLAATASPPLSPQALTRFLEKSAKDLVAVQRLSWFDPNGRALASSLSVASGFSIADRGYFQEILSGREWVVSDLIQTKIEHLPLFTVCRAVRDEKGTLLGIVLATIDPERLDAVLAIERPKQGAINLIDRKGMMVYRYPHIPQTWEQRKWVEATPILKRSLEGEELAFIDIPRYEKNKRIMASVPIRSIGWLAGAGRREEEAIKPIVSDILHQGIAFFSVCLLAFLAGLAIARTISSPVKRLQSHARVLRDGDLGARIAEDGPSELRELSHTFNDMAERLQTDTAERKRAEEALKKAHDELDLRVQERTAELSRAYEKLEAEMAERTKMEEQFRQSQKMEAIGTLAGGIAHDFNNVLAAIIGFTEMVLDDVSDNARVRQKMERVLNAGFRGRDLVRQILTFSRRSDQEKAALHLSPLIQETFKLLRASIPTTIEMKLDLDENRDLAYADPSQMQQIIMNLGTNASHAMREKGGTLEVSLRAISIDTGELLPEPDMAPGEYLVLSVRDAGHGMDDGVMKRIFEPFFTTKEKGQGTGLGLSVVYGIVKSHNGGIHVSSRPGQGSVFSVYLPTASTGEEVESETVSWETLPTGTERILLVDDEEPIVELGQGVLCRLGYTVVAKRSGREALETFRGDGAFDLVITDQTMPGMTGVMLAAELLKLRPDLPVILCTGYSETVSRETAQEVGIREFLMKPLSKRELAGAVRRALEGNK
jgi:signal transduction histidine kinase/ActR/RegA family two-component response regulator